MTEFDGKIHVAVVEQKTFSEWVNDKMDAILKMPKSRVQDDYIKQLQRDIDAHFESLGHLSKSVPGFEAFLKHGAKGMILGGERFPVPFCEYPECPLHRESSPVDEIVMADIRTGARRRILRHQFAVDVFPPVKVWLCGDCVAAPDLDGRILAAADPKVKQAQKI